jgi:hypothetical protein
MRVVAICVVAAAFACGSAVGAIGPWRVLAKAEDDSVYYSSASANVDVTRPKALRIRAFGPSLKVGGLFSCDLPDKRVRSGQAVVLTVSVAESCTVYANASSDSGGKIRVLIEGRK